MPAAVPAGVHAAAPAAASAPGAPAVAPSGVGSMPRGPFPAVQLVCEECAFGGTYRFCTWAASPFPGTLVGEEEQGMALEEQGMALVLIQDLVAPLVWAENQEGAALVLVS